MHILPMTAHTRSVQSYSCISMVLRSRIGMVLTCMLYVVTFGVVYEWVIVPVWGYEGFHSRATLTREAIAWLLASLPSLWIPIKLERPSQVLYWMLYLLVLVPTCLVAICSLEDQSGGPVLLATCLVVVFAFTGLVYRLPLLPLPRVYLERYEFGVILILLSTIFYALLISSFGFRFHFVSLQDIYVVRAQYENTLDRAPSQVAYAISWQAWVINPFVMAMGLRWRRLSWVLVGAAAQLVIYSITGFRSMFFSAGLLLYLLWSMRFGTAFGTRLVSSWTAIFAAAGALKFFGYALTPAALVNVRMTALPGLLTGYYYEFFSSHPHAQLGHSIFKSLVDYPYAVQPPYLIASTYFHNAAMESNANLWADAYANFGYVGIIVFSLLLAFALWLYDSMAFGRDKRLAALVIGLPAFALANTGLLTALLTNGIGLVMLLVYLMPPTMHERSRRHSWRKRKRISPQSQLQSIEGLNWMN